MATCKRLIRYGTNCESSLSRLRGINASKVANSSALPAHRLQSNGALSNSYGSLSSNFSANRFVARKISQLVKPNGNRVFLVDTLKLVKFHFRFSCRDLEDSSLRIC